MGGCCVNFWREGHWLCGRCWQSAHVHGGASSAPGPMLALCLLSVLVSFLVLPSPFFYHFLPVTVSHVSFVADRALVPVVVVNGLVWCSMSVTFSGRLGGARVFFLGWKNITYLYLSRLMYFESWCGRFVCTSLADVVDVVRGWPVLCARLSVVTVQ